MTAPLPNPFTLNHTELVALAEDIFTSYRAGEAFCRMVEIGGEQYDRPEITQAEMAARFEGPTPPTVAELRHFFADSAWIDGAYHAL